MSVYERLKPGTPGFPVGIYNTKYPNGFWLYPHIHREFELLVIKCGTGVMYIDNNEYLIREGNGVFVNSGQLHLGERANDEPCEFYAIVFAPETMSDLGTDAVTEKYIRPIVNKKITPPSYLSREPPWQRDILEIADAVEKINSEKIPASELAAKAKLMEAWRLLYLHSEEREQSPKQGIIDGMITAMEYIRAEYASPLTLGGIAEHVSMSSGHFCRSFSEVMHETPFAYLMRIRVENARRLLREGRIPISEVAEKCGFNSFSYFSKCFREEVGCTPSQYQKRRK